MTQKKNENTPEGWSCPTEIPGLDRILLGHGSGGKLMHDLIMKVFRPLLPPHPDILHDSAYLNIHPYQIALTTDSFVVSPLFFPGGNIGSLAVHGTINDLAVAGAEPIALSASFILEEGFDVKELLKIVDAMKRASAEAGVPIATGDTKVVEKGKCDGVYITTTGVGRILLNPLPTPERIEVGDYILINGFLANHGIAIMLARGNIEFDTQIQSDTAPLHTLIRKLIDENIPIHCMRDATRGGVASVLNELAHSRPFGMRIYENRIPVRDEVKGACELLGLDPLQVANEGIAVFFIPKSSAEHALQILRTHPLGEHAQIIGEVVDDHHGRVVLKTSIGGYRVVDMLAGEQLPRIC